MSSTDLDEWKENTTGFERAQSVIMTVSEPKTAQYIADEAHVSENSARTYLSQLVDLGLVRETESGRATNYYPEPLYTRMQDLRELFDTYDHEGLLEQRADLQSKLDDIKNKYDADSPTALREQAADVDDVEKLREMKKTASDWALLQYRQSIIAEAVRQYDTYANPFPSE